MTKSTQYEEVLRKRLLRYDGDPLVVSIVTMVVALIVCAFAVDIADVFFQQSDTLPDAFDQQRGTLPNLLLSLMLISLAVLALSQFMDAIGRILDYRRDQMELDRLLTSRCIACGCDLRATADCCPKCGKIPPK